MANLGFDLAQGTRLSYLAMVEQFMPENSSGFDTLDPSVQDCLQTRERCTAYSFALTGKPGMRVVIVINAGRVAYKRIDGTALASASKGKAGGRKRSRKRRRGARTLPFRFIHGKQT